MRIDYHVSTPDNSTRYVQFGIRMLDPHTQQCHSFASRLPLTGSMESVIFHLRELAAMLENKAKQERKRRDEAGTPILPGVDPTPPTGGFTNPTC